MAGGSASGPSGTQRVPAPAGLLARAWRAASTNAAQVVVSVVVAGLLALATWLASQASGAWTSSTRLETKAAALLGEDLRHVYQDEVPLALEVSLMQVRADALDAAGVESPAAAVEARVLRKASGELRAALGSSSSSLLAEKYAGADHGYAVNRRLADVVGSSALVARADVLDAVAEGDRYAAGAAWAAGAAVALALGFVVVRVLTRRGRARGSAAATAAAAGSGAGAAEPDIGVVPGPWQERTTLTRLAAGAALLAWLLLPALTAAQLVLGTAAASDGASGSRRATGLGSTILATQLRQGLIADAAQSVVRAQMVSLARRFVDVQAQDPGQEAIAFADGQGADAWAALSARMLALPTHADGVDADIVQLLASGDTEVAADLRLQQEAVDASDRAGGAADLLSLAVLLAGLTAAVAAMAKVAGFTGRLATGAAAGLVAAAVVVAGIAVLHAT
ncbi:hypothetical protein [Intrasporangium sp. YIM S08009]|uniref:hypothetical protein n=1 Tax=Intrasporangium zincisolvens TaxID=3080018 RepID=UPI002B0612F8|nr:hypothetical protein [Intrasporangium sp. YIM S08009]